MIQECLKMIPSLYKDPSPAMRMRQLKQECKLKLQLCAILSQIQNHHEALKNAKLCVKLAHQLFKDLLELCAYYIKKMDSREEAP